ncbi:T9SS type A sorting domain-containing protein [Taibaiella soli]|uniref:T9SS C-terminal target domain-containing protein n=1 Tax=Taibaiella soli TaxID=1649169 RepID=A0A2W2AFU1_9BACT|nr:T9SS type A sorting domain-containing protein [Taibaiella soli]PZF71090.1 T9SS C-terminal target domain-containing protein [Taibaiella soli]
MKKAISAIILSLSSLSAAQAQFAPQAGVSGTTAIPASSSQFVGWATHCDVQRGWMDIADQSLGRVSAGDSSVVVGAPDNYIMSLGDSGVAVLTFAHPIVNGPGYDFAVFENGFANPNNPEEAYLEFAFVEVSSDGVNYVRFPVTSNTQDTAQIAGTGEYMVASLVNNLAGKYIGNYGTPFDLSELSGAANLDLNNITHVRLVDVIGSIGALGTVDMNNHKINDPYPTPFPTGGFDLDAVGVINQSTTGVATINGNNAFRIYPNPATEKIVFHCDRTPEGATLSLTDVTGKIVLQQSVSGNDTEINLNACASGLYYLVLNDAKGNKWVEKISKL